jgi:hypothetical protein
MAKTRDGVDHTVESQPRRVPRWACVGLVALAAGFAPWTAHADEGWAAGRQFRLYEADSASPAPAAADRSLVASATPGSILIAQAGGGGAAAPADGWHFSLAPYLWGPRTTMSLDVGQLSGSTTIDFVDVVPQLHFAFASHFEATVERWTAFGDLLYMSMGQSQTQNGISTSINLQQLFFEFGATYRLGPVSLGQAGRLTFEPLAGGRVIWLDVSLGFPNQKVSNSAGVIDPMIGGRLTYHITDTVALWFRGDAAGFGVGTELTVNLIAGLEWRFHPRASALVGWRYMDIDLEKDSGSSTLNAEIEMNGPFLGLNVLF